MTKPIEIDFVIRADSEGDVLIVEITLPQGVLMVIAEFDLEGRRIAARGLHIDGIGVDPNSLGPLVLRWIAQTALERLDYDELIIEGGRRTTGAGPGRVPKPVRFKRAPAPTGGRE